MCITGREPSAHTVCKGIKDDIRTFIPHHNGMNGVGCAETTAVRTLRCTDETRAISRRQAAVCRLKTFSPYLITVPTARITLVPRLTWNIQTFNITASYNVNKLFRLYCSLQKKKKGWTELHSRLLALCFVLERTWVQTSTGTSGIPLGRCWDRIIK
jgi:hypothetical protein